MALDNTVISEGESAQPFSPDSLKEVSCSENDDVEDDGHRKLPGFNRSFSREWIESKQTPPQMIDNSNLTYIPIHLMCGVTVQCRPDVLTRCPQILRDLEADVRQCLSVLPKSTHSLVRRTNIWVSTTYYYGPSSDPHHVNHTTTHHHEAWLMSQLDRPEKAPGIEIYNCFDYRRMRWHWNGCGLLLHELCHVIHNICLSLDNPAVEEAYEVAKQSGRYDVILRRDWAGSHDGDTDMAYAMVDPREFFAELSVAFLSHGYEELATKDYTSMAESSPPFTAKEVVNCLDPSIYRIGDKSLMQKASLFLRPRLSTHCNKFYPFTRGQFQRFDPDQFEVFEKLWLEIATWEDEGVVPCVRCWPFI